MNLRYRSLVILITLMLAIVTASSRLRADSGTCGGATTTVPFTDVGSSIFFCQIAEAYFSGLTNGTSPTTFSPADPVPREQMAAFVTRTLDQSLKRGSRRAALKQWSTPSTGPLTGITGVGNFPTDVECDGADLWVANTGDGTVIRVRASDGKRLETWTGAGGAQCILVARGRIYITGDLTLGTLYVIDPTQSAGAVSTLSTSLGSHPLTIDTDGTSIWTANSNSVSKVDPDSGTSTNITTGFSQPFGVLFDGTSIWVTDSGDNTIKKLDSGGNIVQTINTGSGPEIPVFDGTNIWAPNSTSNSVSVIRASTGSVVATLTGNGLAGPGQAAFDGQRVLVISGSRLSFWRATDLTPLGFAVSSINNQIGVCSDGVNFWIAGGGTIGRLLRF